MAGILSLGKASRVQQQLTGKVVIHQIEAIHHLQEVAVVVPVLILLLQEVIHLLVGALVEVVEVQVGHLAEVVEVVDNYLLIINAYPTFINL